MVEGPYRFTRARAERTIAATRVAIAAFSLCAVWLDPAESARSGQFTYLLLATYVAYSIALAAVMWRRGSGGWLPIATHVADIAAFSVFQYLTPFTLFIFSLFSAAVRWGWQGVLASAPPVLLAFVVVSLAPSADPFALDRFVIRVGYLVIVAVLLVYLGRHEARLRDEIRRLAGWPSTVGDDRGAVIRHVLEHAAGIVAAGRVVAIWEPDQEPRVQLAVLTPGDFHLTQYASADFDPWVPDKLVGTSFLAKRSDDSSDAAPVITVRRQAVAGWSGEAAHPAILAHLGASGVASAPFQTERLVGRVFFGDLDAATVEVLPLVEVVAREIGASVDLREMHDRSRQVAIGEERIRVARDLHDGVLQSLTGMRFELQNLATQLTPDSLDQTRIRLLAIERALAMEQRELRFFIEDLQPIRPAVGDGATLTSQLEELGDQIAVQWQTPITVRFIGDGLPLPPDIEHAVPRMVHEAIINALKHAGPSRVAVTVESHVEGLRIVVADDGRGFPFVGEYDHATLVQRNLGPASLRERVASLGGQVSVESSASGSKVEIRLPLPAHA